MRAALEVETLKARRAPVFRWAALTLALGAPGLTALFFVLARTGGEGTAAVKAAAMLPDLTMSGYLMMVGQVLSIAALLCGGIVAAWSFGREFVDDAAPGLFAVATTRGRLAAAKLAVLVIWGLLAVAAGVLVALAVGLALGLDLDAAAARRAAQDLVGGWLVVALTVPFGWVASWRRGYLAGIVALIVCLVLTQVVTALGGGGWFPYAAPSLWLGMGGAPAAAAVGIGQLLLPLVVGGVAGAATVRWWQRAEVF